MAHQLGDGPIEKRFRAQMNVLAQTLDEFLNGDATGADRKNGFVLLVFPFGHEGRANYISNAKREDVLVLLKEQVARFEGQADVTGKA